MKLKVGKAYWIFNGMMNPTQGILTEIVNDGRTGVFSNLNLFARQVARKSTSIYNSKEEALKSGKY